MGRISRLLEGSEDRIKGYLLDKENKLANVTQSGVENQLGNAIGDLMSEQLPTLSIDRIQSRNCIEVNKEDTEKYEALDAEFSKHVFEKTESEEYKKAWSELLSFRKEMNKKYLPPTVDFAWGNIYVNDWESFKDGLRNAFWNSDICNYKINTNDDIKIDNSHWHSTNISLVLAED